MLDDVVPILACPHCGDGLVATGQRLRCGRDHSFDVARQGYVSLLPPRGRAVTGDTAAMVGARVEFLNAGHYAPLTRLIAQRVADLPALDASGEPGYLVDVGAGTGHYLTAALEHLPGHAGLALDASKYAARRAARAHERVGAVVADAWRELPVLDGVASVVLNVFAPRNAAEMHRILRPGGHLVLVTPEGGHLVDLVDRLDLVSVDERKPERVSEQLDPLFEPLDRTPCEFALSLSRDDTEALVAMGPSAWHVSPDSVRERVGALREPVTVTASVVVSTYRPRTGS